MSQDIVLASEGTSALAGFDYTALDMETRITVQSNTRAIRERMGRAAQDIADVGGYLADTRDRLGHGLFLAWLAAEFDMSERTAYNYIAVNQQFKSANFAEMSVAVSALYLLAAPSTPEPAREEALQRAATGEVITPRKAQEIVTAHKPPREARGGGASRSATPAAPPPPLALIPLGGSAPPPLMPVASATPVVLTPLADPVRPAPEPAPDDSGDEDGGDEIATLFPSVPAPATPPTPTPPTPTPLHALASAVAGGVADQQLRLLSAIDLLLTEAQQQVRVQLDELRGTGAPTYTAPAELLRQNARQLVDGPVLREAGAMLAAGLREAQPAHSLAEILRSLCAMEAGEAGLAGLDDLDRALEALSAQLSDATYEQLALRTYRLRQPLLSAPVEVPEVEVLQALTEGIESWWEYLDGTTDAQLDDMTGGLRYLRAQAARSTEAESAHLIERIDDLLRQLSRAERGAADET